jgi:putative ABC transport system permease protein
LLNLATETKDAATRTAVIRRVERALEAAGLAIETTVPTAVLRTAVGEHMSVLIGLLLALAGLMTAVGVLGLTSAMGIAVLERTRELGVMRAVGATPATVLRLIMGEGVFVGALSGLLAVALAAPLSAIVGSLVGTLAFRAPLPLVMSPPAVLAWLLLVLLLSAAATAAPAIRASRMTVREALVHT